MAASQSSTIRGFTSENWPSGQRARACFFRWTNVNQQQGSPVIESVPLRVAYFFKLTGSAP